MINIFVIVGWLLTAVQVAIIARSLFSWVDPTGRTPVGAFLVRITEPIMAPIRRLMPATGFMDFSPLVALLLIVIVRSVLGV